MLALTQITRRPLVRPQYAQAETFDAWLRINADLVHTYWRDLSWASGDDPDRLAYAELVEFAKCQYEASAPEADDVADCDCCGVRKGTHTVTVCGIETWACDECTDVSPFGTANAWQDRDADDAGVPMYGEL